LPEEKPLKIADIGCGTGAQTLTLAKHINGRITAVDLFPEFLDKLDERASGIGLKDRIYTLKSSMEELPFGPEEFDIIWSEGAIYIIGFEHGVKKWKNFIKPGGYLAVSEITWITTSRPSEIEDFWIKEYPGIDMASRKIKIMEENGFTLQGYFNLTKNSWIKNYYKPMEEGFESFLQRNNHTELAKKVVNDTKDEIDLYKRYSDFFSYGFYIARKNE
jgi:ubiquinone/menaquinone biosynthesis C-methylase UbiE